MIDNLDMETASLYLEGMSRIESQEALLQLNVSAYPHMKKEDQSKTHQRLHSIAYPKEKKKITLDELEVMLRG